MVNSAANSSQSRSKAGSCLSALLASLAVLLVAIPVQSAPPVLDTINFSPTTPNEAESITFVMLATDPEGQTMTRAWDFGDGFSSTDESPTHAYAADGSFTVQVTVTDSAGGSSSVSTVVTVDNASPLIQSLGGDLTGETNATFSFQGVATDPGGDPLTYTWDWGDGSPQESGSSLSSHTHVFTSAGVYLVTWIVTDGQGAATQQTISVEVNAPPVLDTINFSPTTPEEAESITFVVLATDPEGQTMTRAWDFGDGFSSTDESPTHAYAADGSFTVQVTVTDSAGGSSSVSTVVTVDNASPLIQSLGGDLTGETNATFSFQGVATDPGGDPLTYTWDWGDGSPQESGSSLSSHTHVFTSAGVYLVTLIVADDQGAETQQTISVAVNALPVISQLNVDQVSSVEGDIVAFEVVASDPDGHTISYSWDFGDNSPLISSATPAHVFVDDGDYTVTVTVTDQLGAARSSSVVFSVLNGPPVLLALVGSTTGVMGQSLSFAGSVQYPAGIADTLTWTWDWGEGLAPTVGVDESAPSHIWSGAGTFPMVLSVADEDGGSFTQPISVLISNPGPTVGAISGLSTVDEGQSNQWSVVAVDAAGNPVTLSWDWGDGSSVDSGLDLSSPSHVYADDGSYTITVVGSDQYGGSGSSSFTVSVQNIAPTFTATPPEVATEGIGYSALLTSTDPGADPPIYTTLQAPTGTLYHAPTASLVWHPTLAQVLAGPALFEVQVDDGDGGTDTLSWSVVASWADVDLDGMADSWEESFGLNTTLDDSQGDPDVDGVPNLQEWLDGTDPTVSNGPDKPVPLSPILGESSTTEIPVLVVENAPDPDGNVLSYEFEVYEDAALSTLLYAGTEPEDSDGETEHSSAAGFPENAIVYWRARATDGGAIGPWSRTSEFFMDAVNNRPGTPQPLYPVNTTVPGPTPPLSVAPVSEPEYEDVVVTVSLYGDGIGLVATLVGSPDGSGDGGWVFPVPAPLDEDLVYEWSAVAVDARGASSLPSERVWFDVDAANTPPPLPSFQDLEDELSSQTPTLVALAEEDADGDAQVLRFEVSPQEDFASVEGQFLGTVEPDADGIAQIAVPYPLSENAVAWARVRAEDDRGGVSAWVRESFFVNSLEQAPGPVVVTEPGDGQTLAGGTAVTVRWAPALDVDRDELTYTLRILRDDESAEVVWEQAGLVVSPSGGAVPEGEHLAELELDPGGYLVSGRAVDDTGLEGPWGPANGFVVLATPGAGIDLDDFGSGCACSTGSPKSPPPVWLWALLLAALAPLRRRRR